MQQKFTWLGLSKEPIELDAPLQFVKGSQDGINRIKTVLNLYLPIESSYKG
jgi:hypothetical protein